MRRRPSSLLGHGMGRGPLNSRAARAGAPRTSASPLFKYGYAPAEQCLPPASHRSRSKSATEQSRVGIGTMRRSNKALAPANSCLRALRSAAAGHMTGIARAYLFENGNGERRVLKSRRLSCVVYSDAHPAQWWPRVCKPGLGRSARVFLNCDEAGPLLSATMARQPRHRGSPPNNLAPANRCVRFIGRRVARENTSSPHAPGAASCSTCARKHASIRSGGRGRAGFAAPSGFG